MIVKEEPAAWAKPDWKLQEEQEFDRKTRRILYNEWINSDDAALRQIGKDSLELLDLEIKRIERKFNGKEKRT